MTSMTSEHILNLWDAFLTSEWVNGLPAVREKQDPESHLQETLTGSTHVIEGLSKDVDLFSIDAVLDIGCSAGTKVIKLKEFSPKLFVAGIEPHHSALAAAQALSCHELGKEEASRVGFIQGVGEKLPYPDATFDLVVCHTVLEHVHDVQKVVSEIHRVLKPGGKAHIQCPNYVWFWEPHLQIVCIPLLGKRITKFFALLQGKWGSVDYLDHLKFVTCHQIMRFARDLGMEIENKAAEKFRAIAEGDFSKVKFFRSFAKLLSLSSSLGISGILCNLAVKLGLYPSIMLILTKREKITSMQNETDLNRSANANYNSPENVSSVPLKLDYWREKYLLPAIKDSVSSGKKIALLGTGDPRTYLALCKARGYRLEDLFDPLRLEKAGANYTIFDINPDQIAGISELGINAAVHDITQAQLSDSYDYIFASDVIEHVDNPIAMLAHLKRSLAKGGRLVVTTPNAGYWRNFVTHSYVEFHEHNFCFSKKHFENLARKIGFTIEELISFQAYDARIASRFRPINYVHQFFASYDRGSSLLFVVHPVDDSID